MRHHELGVTFTKLMKEVSAAVVLDHQPFQVESFKHNTTATEDSARLDIKVNGLWDSRFSSAFFDVKVFNPFGKIYPNSIPESWAIFYENQKKLNYEPGIVDVENSAFNPLAFACRVGAGPSAGRIMSRKDERQEGRQLR